MLYNTFSMTYEQEPARANFLESSLLPQGTGTTDVLSPSISFDRALSHYAEYVDIDLPAIQEFYYGLPHEDKLPLDKLHIHFSASRPENHLTDVVTFGRFSTLAAMRTNRKHRRTTPELGDTGMPTICIFVGSFIPELRNKKVVDATNPDAISVSVSQEISETLAHELTHFAQRDERCFQTLSRFKALKSDTKNRFDKFLARQVKSKKEAVLGIAVGLASELSGNSHNGSLLMGIGATALSNLLHRKDRKIAEAKEDFQNYLANETEIEARESEENAPLMFYLKPHDERTLAKGLTYDSFKKPVESWSEMVTQNEAHKELAFTPRNGDPKKVAKDAFKSRRQAIPIRYRARTKSKA